MGHENLGLRGHEECAKIFYKRNQVRWSTHPETQAMVL